MFAGGCHTRMSVLDDVLFISIVVSLASRQDSRLNIGSVHRASIAAAVTRDSPPTWGRGSHLCGLL